MQHAYDVFGLFAPQRDPRIFGGQDLSHQFFRRQVRIDHHHFGAVNHHVRNLKLAEIQQTTQHVAVLLFDLAFVVKQIDRAAQPFEGRQYRLVVAGIDADQPQQHANNGLDDGEQRPQHEHHEFHRSGDEKRDPVRRVDGDRLRQHLGEDHDQNRHDGGRIEHADFTEPYREDAGCESRSADVGHIVAEQERADHPLAHVGKARDDAGILIAELRQPQHAGTRGAGKRGLARREECGDQETDNHYGKRNPFHGAKFTSSVSSVSTRMIP